MFSDKHILFTVHQIMVFSHCFPQLIAKMPTQVRVTFENCILKQGLRHQNHERHLFHNFLI